MKLEQSFEVAAPIDRVWSALIDIERVAPCLPGATVAGRNDDGSYDGTFKVKIGPTSASYSGKLQMEDLNEAEHTATMQAHGTDKRGQGGAKATILSKVQSEAEDRTRVEVITDYHITGRLARFGRGGMIEDISERLLKQFAQCLQSSLAGTPDAAQTPAAGGDGGSAGNGAEPASAEQSEPAAESATAEAPEAASEAPAPATPAPPPAPAAPAPPPAPDAGGTPPWTPDTAGEPLDGLSLVTSVLWTRVRRNPAPALATAVGFLLALLLLRRRRR